MESKYRVFSADWEIEVTAKCFVDAVLKGTKAKYDELGELFNIAQVVAVVKIKNDQHEVFPSVAVLEDLNMYYLARHLHAVLNFR